MTDDIDQRQEIVWPPAALPAQAAIQSAPVINRRAVEFQRRLVVMLAALFLCFHIVTIAIRLVTDAVAGSYPTVSSVLLGVEKALVTGYDYLTVVNVAALALWLFTAFSNVELAEPDGPMDPTGATILLSLPYVRLLFGFPLTRRVWHESLRIRGVSDPGEMARATAIVAGCWISEWIATLVYLLATHTGSVQHVAGYGQAYACMDIIQRSASAVNNVATIMIVNGVSGAQKAWRQVNPAGQNDD